MGGFVLVAALVALVSALTAGAIAYRKGLSVGDAVIVGVCVGIFGVIITAWREPDWLALEERRVRMGQAKRCPWCMTLAHPAARICPHCHAWYDH